MKKPNRRVPTRGSLRSQACKEESSWSNPPGARLVFRLSNPVVGDETHRIKELGLEVAAVLVDDRCVRGPDLQELVEANRESVRRALGWLHSRLIDVRYDDPGRCWEMQIDPTIPWRETTVGAVVDQRLLRRVEWVPLKLALQSGAAPYGGEQLEKERLASYGLARTT